jgi:hypothetical protein
MSNEQQTSQQVGCSLPNLLLRLFLIGGPVLGWSLARPYGWWRGLLERGQIGFCHLVNWVGDCGCRVGSPRSNFPVWEVLPPDFRH